jgi:methylated-DNA-protein-cysteine methyltransferase related protein
LRAEGCPLRAAGVDMSAASWWPEEGM